MVRSVRTRAVFRRFALLGACALLAACTLDTDVSEPTAVIRYQGDNQAAAVNTTLQTDLAVIVVNQFGERLKNVNVGWEIVSGGGSLSVASSVTDESGIASVGYTTGNTPGTAIIHAKVHGLLPLSFTITIN
jgi:hypothetical protein